MRVRMWPDRVGFLLSVVEIPSFKRWCHAAPAARLLHQNSSAVFVLTQAAKQRRSTGSIHGRAVLGCEEGCESVPVPTPTPSAEMSQARATSSIPSLI